MAKFLLPLFFFFCYASPSSAQDARWGYQLSFDGTNDYFRADGVSAAVAGNSWTIEFWFRSTRNVTYTEAIFSFNPSDGTNRIEMGIGPSSGNKLYLYSSGSSPSTIYGTTTIATNTWNHVAVTFNYSDNTMSLYLNGSSTAEVSRVYPVGNRVQSTDLFSLGQEWDNATASGFFAGQLDEVRVWSGIRSNSDITANQYRQVATNASGLLAYYKMTNNTGTSVTDNTGNGRTGTLVNGTAWQTSTVTKNTNGTVSSDQSIDEGDLPADMSITDFPYSSVQWQASPNGTDWTNISGATSGTLTGAQTGTLEETSYFRARLDNGYGTYDYGNTITVTVIPGTLPVRWLDFTGQQKGTGILLAWRTAAEERVKHFEIEHHAEAGNWQRIGTVAAAGNSSETQRYQFVHTNPYFGNNTYRIAEVASDGERSYSKVITISGTGYGRQVLLYPNPVVSDILTVKMETNTLVRIVDVQGRLLFQKQLSAGTNTISTLQFPKGNYWLNAGKQSIQFTIQ